ncbi:MAG: glycosidase, partial [Deltaproteobacteria bacterium]|nr:glycosidase [Deltaproteobacteria bacterium]
PTKPTPKASIYLARHFGLLGVELGGLWAGSSRNGDAFQIANDDQLSTYTDHVLWSDDFGAKLKLSIETGRYHWYASAAYMGLVANGGPTQAITYTGWSLTDSGSGNQANALTGLAVNLGSIQIGPNFLWQKPIVGPVPASAGRPRNVLDDPFVVRGNREQVAAELMIVYDPTPGTWMWAWDNDLREDAGFAASLDLSFRHMMTTQDSGIGVQADGTLFAFNGAPPAHDLFEARARFVGAPLPGLRLVGHVWGGQGESTGLDPRVVTRFGADARAAWNQVAFSAMAKFNDWGPYDYDRDFNLTYPLQLMGDLAYTLGPAKWLGLFQTRVGIRGTLRYLDKYSNRFSANPDDPTQPGREYELRTYLNVSL